ncbi:MAG: hypothetical protein QXV11_03935 [Desulfurococcaceae archaeon]
MMVLKEYKAVVLKLKIKVLVDIAKYPHVTLRKDQALKFLDAITRRHGVTKDLEEARRVIYSFNEYYGAARRKSDGYLVIPKDSSDAVRGRVVIHKIKLLIENNEEIVEIILDRRVSKGLIEYALKEIGYSEIEYSQID